MAIKIMSEYYKSLINLDVEDSYNDINQKDEYSILSFNTNTNILSELAKCDETKDVKIICEKGEIILAHKCILYLKSDYFKSAFKFKSNATIINSDLIINNINYNILKNIIDYYYYGKITINYENYWMYYYAFDFLCMRYELNLLMSKIKFILSHNYHDNDNILFDVLKINNIILNEFTIDALINLRFKCLNSNNIKNYTKEFKKQLSDKLKSIDNNLLLQMFVPDNVSYLYELITDPDLRDIFPLSTINEIKYVFENLSFNYFQKKYFIN